MSSARIAGRGNPRAVGLGSAQMCVITADFEPTGIKNTCTGDDYTVIVKGMAAKAAMVGVPDGEARMPSLLQQRCVLAAPQPVRRFRSLCKPGKLRCQSSGCTSWGIRIYP